MSAAKLCTKKPLLPTRLYPRDTPTSRNFKPVPENRFQG